MDPSSHNRRAEATREGLQNAALWWRESPSFRTPAIEESILRALAPFLTSQARRFCVRSGGRLELDDACQVARLAVIRALSTWKPEKASFWSWCYSCVTNALREAARETDRDAPLELLADQGETSAHGLPIEALLDLHNALSTLPERERFAIEQYYFCERGLADIGGDLGLGAERVRQIRQRGLFTLKRRFPHLSPDAPDRLPLADSPA